MEPIQASLSEWMKKSNLEKKLAKMEKEVLKNSHVQSFLQNEEHQITNKMIEKGLVKLYDFQKERTNCDGCKGLAHCKNMMKGYEPQLVVVRDSFDLHYRPCSYKIEDEKQKKQQQLMKSLYVPSEILMARFDTMDRNEEREEACHQALAFALNAQPGEDGHGLYLYGKFGVGKTYIMGAVMNGLRNRQIESLIVYTPDFFREMRQAISDGTFQEKIDTVKKASVLILDDIGAETISGWIRDDVLGAILQYRMLEKLPTLFTSNYNYDELEEHLAYSERGGFERLKAKRIMERIRHFTTFVTVRGKNRRKR